MKKIAKMTAAGNEWVLCGEGAATRKRDGTACAVIGGVLHARYDAKRGKTPPPGAIPCQDPDPATGHWPHWVRVDLDAPAYRWHAEAWAALAEPLPDGTYELCGPAVNGNAEGLAGHVFFRHGEEVLDRVPRTMDGIRKFLERNVMEGIVFHREDGRMAKIRRKDFGLPWGGR